jgi:hypothetical protein
MKWLPLALLAPLAGCGIGLQRDLSGLMPASVVYDDMCGVQAYHDAIESGKNKPPRVVRAADINRAGHDRPLGGTVTYAFEDEFNLDQLRKMLAENWSRVPAGYLSASRLELEVQWSEKAGVRRVITTKEAQISNGKQSQYLPYQVCLSELLYGGPLYKTRRAMLNLPPLEGAPGEAAAAVSTPPPPVPAPVPALPP